MKAATYVIAYDIRDDRIRARVYRVLRSYGIWAEKSVFECKLTPLQLQHLQRDLTELMNPDTDILRIYRLSPTPVAVFAYGKTLEQIPQGPVLIL